MSAQLPEVTAQAALTVYVSRHASGDLTDGVRRRLADIDAVREVEGFAVRGLRPGLNDLTVDVDATLRLRCGDRDPDAVAATLVDAFGVREANVAAVSRNGPP